MKTIRFDSPAWQTELQTAYTFRYTQTPRLMQLDDCVTTRVNPSHPEGYDNVSLLTKERFGVGSKASLTCSFEGLGCPEIILVEQVESCPDGALRYGACIEVVLYENGINVWRHFRTDGVCSWHKRLGIQYPVAAGEKHLLSVEVKEQMLCITLDGQTNFLRVEDLFESFHMGVTACEGIARLYEFSVES